MSNPLFPQQRFHVTEALVRTNTEVQEVMDPAPGFSFVSLPALVLANTISFRGREYSHVDLERCLTDDHLEGMPQDRTVEISPSLSLKLTNGNDEREGLITRVDFADYALSQGFFSADGTPKVPLSRLLVPVEYSVYPR